MFRSVQIKDAMGNDHGRPKDIVGEVRQAFTSTADTAFDVCLDNQLVGRSKSSFTNPESQRAWGNSWNHLLNSSLLLASPNPTREVELDVEIGADARDWSSIQAQEKLKPIETDLRRIEDIVSDIVTEMEYLRAREQRLRDTNESTNERVKWFAFGTMGMLVGLGAWQVVYLRAYFRSKHLI